MKERVEERLCLLCQEKKVEDEHHFFLDCPFYDHERKKLWNQVERITGTKERDLVSREQRLNALVGDYFQARAASQRVARAARAAKRRRGKLSSSGQGGHGLCHNGDAKKTRKTQAK